MNVETEQPVPNGADSDPATMDDRVANLMGLADDVDEVDADESAPEKASETAPAENAEAEVEFELDGQTFKGPQALKDGVMRTTDYTRKTQELATQRQLAETLIQQAKSVAAQNAFSQATAKEARELAGIDEQLEQYATVDLRSISAEDANRYLLEINQLRSRRELIDKTLRGKRSEFDAAMTEHRQTLHKQGSEFLRKAIPKWDDQLAKAVTEHALNDGYTSEEVANILDPRMVRTLWKAREYDLLQTQKADAVKKVTAASPTVKPAAVQAQNKEKGEFLNYRKSLAQAKTPAQRDAAIQARFASKIR